MGKRICTEGEWRGGATISTMRLVSPATAHASSGKSGPAGIPATPQTIVLVEDDDGLRVARERGSPATAEPSAPLLRSNRLSAT